MKKFAATLALAAAAGLASADELISNLPGNDGSQTAGINDGSRTKGMGFAMPGGDGYFLDNVVARLNITDVNVVPRFEIFSDDAGGPGVSLTVLDNPTIDTLGIDNYTFTPSSDFVLDANTTYWVVASSVSGVYDWKASSPSETPTGIATHVGATFGAYPPRNASSILVSYAVNGTLVPAPAGVALLGLGGLFATRRRR